MAKEISQRERGGELAGRRIIITGGASGIGLATARLFMAQGASLALLDRDAAAVENVAAELSCSGHVVDISNDEGVERAVSDAAASMGGIDGLVLAAGIMSGASFADTDATTWRNVIAVNLTGTYLVCHAALKWLQEADKATVVTLSSGQALLPGASGSAYAASKGGVLVFSKALAVELAPTVRVNTVCPGAVDTPMAAKAFEGLSEATLNEIKARYALKRLSTADELAQAILFLTGDRSSSITGTAMAVDCGRTFH